jgi:hypothetical protein
VAMAQHKVRLFALEDAMDLVEIIRASRRVGTGNNRE